MCYVVQAPRPKTELALPYGAYCLTRSNGSRVERLDKHPFCMSRVYYDATEKPEEVRSSCLPSLASPAAERAVSSRKSSPHGVESHPDVRRCAAEQVC